MKVHINSKPYEVPTNYSEVKYINFAHLKTEGLTLEQKLLYQTTIPIEILTNLPLSSVRKLIELTEFFESEPEIYEPYVSDLSIGNEHYIKLEQSRQALSGNPWFGIIEVVKTYTGIDITDVPVTKAYGIAAFFLTRCQRSTSDTKDSASTSMTKTS